MAALDSLSFMPECAKSTTLGRNTAWAPLETETERLAAAAAKLTSTGKPAPAPSGVPDIEDSFSAVHDAACAQGDHMYADPATGYLAGTYTRPLFGST